MSIKIFKQSTPIADLVGKFVIAGRSYTRDTVTGPRLITKVEGKTRLHYVSENRGKSTYFDSSAALYVCDTAEEGEALFNLVYVREQEAEKAANEAAAIVRHEYGHKLTALIKGDV